MRIGIKLDDAGFGNMDLSKQELGNPGIGGTAFEEVLLASEMAKRGVIVEFFSYQ